MLTISMLLSLASRRGSKLVPLLLAGSILYVSFAIAVVGRPIHQNAVEKQDYVHLLGENEAGSIAQL